DIGNHVPSVRRVPELDVEAFISERNQTRADWTLSDGSQQIMRCYLLIGADERHAVFFHGSHTLMDACPTLRAFGNLLCCMCHDSNKDLADLPWGTEWTNLPVGPVSATGGPRDDWETSGIEMIQKVVQAHQPETPTRGLVPQRQTVMKSSKPVHVHSILSDDVSAELLRAVKNHGHGLTISHIFEAAQALAILKLHPVPEEDLVTSHITWPGAIYTLDGWMVPPYNSEMRFVSSLGLFPIIVQCKEILWQAQREERIVSLAKIIESQWKEYLVRPHFPHLLAVIIQLNPPLVPTISSNPYSTTYTNLGIIDKVLPKIWAVDETGSDTIVIQDMSFGHWLTTPTVLMHIWTMESKIHVQVEANDMWDEDYLQSYLDEIVHQAENVLPLA
ncbi:hypothetical protein EVG20_g11008, partial [Dentipellis fragilis]